MFSSSTVSRSRRRTRKSSFRAGRLLQLLRRLERGFHRVGRGAEYPVDFGIFYPNGLYAIFGHVDVSAPHNGVENQLAVVVVLPVIVKMAKGHSNAAAGYLACGSGRAVVSPHGDLVLGTSKWSG